MLGPGGKYVLDRDLTCLQTDVPGVTDYEDRVGVLKIVGGATLDMNGHTIACDPSDPRIGSAWGIVVRDAAVKDGTVRGCQYGIVASRSFVKKMKLDGNETGVQLREKEGSGGNLIVSSIAMNNLRYGFYMQETKGEALFDNVAQNNGAGFGISDAGVTLVGNVALKNRGTGFQADGGGWQGEPTRLTGNRAEENLTGFDIENEAEIVGNIARNNRESGFAVRGRTLDGVRQNFAQGNGDDGFRLELDDNMTTPKSLSHNYAVGNAGLGVHVIGLSSSTPAQPNVTITRNTAIRNLTGDLGDDTDCKLAQWVDNRFKTATEACID